MPLTRKTKRFNFVLLECLKCENYFPNLDPEDVKKSEVRTLTFNWNFRFCLNVNLALEGLRIASTNFASGTPQVRPGSRKPRSASGWQRTSCFWVDPGGVGSWRILKSQRRVENMGIANVARSGERVEKGVGTRPWVVARCRAASPRRRRFAPATGSVLPPLANASRARVLA